MVGYWPPVYIFKDFNFIFNALLLPKTVPRKEEISCYLTHFGQYGLNCFRVKICPRSQWHTQKYDSRSSVSAALRCSS